MSATIGGSLPFQGPPSAASYTQQYQVALAQNQANYNNILSGYQSTQQAQEAAQQGIQQGYSTLSTNVLNTIQGISASQQQQINDVYSQNSGAAAQDLINRGLGNTTVANSVQRGMLSDQQKASINLANQTAGLTAGYQSNLGLAGLNYANQANMQNTGLKQSQLGYMASQQMPYPNALGYAQFQRQGMPMGGGGGRPPTNFGPSLGGGGTYPGGGGGSGGTYDQVTPASYGYQMRPTTGGGGGGQSLNYGNANIPSYGNTFTSEGESAEGQEQGTPQYFPAFASQFPFSQPGSGYIDQSSDYTQPGGDAMYPAQDYGGSNSYYAQNYTQPGGDAQYPAQDYYGGMSADEASGAMDQGEGDYEDEDYEEPEEEDYGDTENDYDSYDDY